MGGLWGSFANVCIYRLPLDKGVISGRSYCTKCEKQISWYDNIPIISYLLIQGKCRKCKKKISLQYMLVEILSISGTDNNLLRLKEKCLFRKNEFKKFLKKNA